jgi:hypothetical protein
VVFDRELIEAQLSLDLIGSSDMPKIAWDALVAGLDGPGIRRLAALETPTYFGVRDVLPRAMQEMGLVSLARNEAALRIARSLANEILDRGADPLKYKNVFLHLWTRSGYAKELQSMGTLDDEIYLAYTLEGLSEEKVRERARERLKQFMRGEL